jgi:hypothetical protein
MLPPPIIIPETNPFIDEFIRELADVNRVNELYIRYKLVLETMGIDVTDDHVRALCISLLCFTKSLFAPFHHERYSSTIKWIRKKHILKKYINHILQLLPNQTMISNPPRLSLPRMMMEKIKSFFVNVNYDHAIYEIMHTTPSDIERAFEANAAMPLQWQLETLLYDHRFSSDYLKKITCGLYAFLSHEPTKEMIITYLRLLREYHDYQIDDQIFRI